MWLPLFLGAKIVTVLSSLDYKLIVDSVRKYKVSILVSTPTFLYGYLQKSVSGDFDSVKYLVSGADKLPVQIRDDYQRLHNKEILEGYGTTETSPVVSLNIPGQNRKGSIGKPLPEVKIKVIDYETGVELPRGKEGIILVKGDLVMKGYFNDIELTHYRIRDGWYDTGDMGVYDDEGYLYHRGRLRRFVKIGGEMISLVKIEETIGELLPEETLCCVVDIPDSIKGSEIVAVMTTKEINQKELKKKLAKTLPPIAIPKTFIVMEELPMSPSGKVNFRAIEDICRNGQLEES
jgi:acyl-[acyl-carrier-protein]-phospholipid O-acyltransferase/long-chain-fatty-acid--[acyl-carrier-protein] ligase